MTKIAAGAILHHLSRLAAVFNRRYPVDMTSRIRVLAEKAIYAGIGVITAAVVAFAANSGWEAVSR